MRTLYFKTMMVQAPGIGESFPHARLVITLTTVVVHPFGSTVWCGTLSLLANCEALTKAGEERAGYLANLSKYPVSCSHVKYS